MAELAGPDLGPGLPVYPELPQVCRVSAGSIGNNVYPALIQQYNGALAFRDREACYVWEPNGISLSPGYYDCRLIGSHLGLPLFAATCCPTGTFSSSSSSR